MFIFLIIKAAIIIALIKIALILSDQWIPAGIYAAILFFSGLFMGHPFLSVLISSVIGFALAAIYFWLLTKFEGSGFIFWLILVIGLVIVFF
ncbi:MAG: hypothetical protein JSW64_10735 [Candidatus Zixiibacteriota bacterium]|nr:MAG: hypothetical protein JSW64_10735 [candidate division Zixibacteria bacterium]